MSNKKIPFLRPNLVKHNAFIKYLSQIEKTRLYSNYGPLNSLFEQRVLHEFFDVNGSVSTVNNATNGLILAINQNKRPTGRFALMPSFTFSATPLAALWCGLEPYFVDIRKDDWCMSEDLLEDALKKLGEEVAIVVPYATFGTDLNLSFYEKLHQSGVPVVIDAAASFGTFGSNGQFGKRFPGVVVFSFHATKSFGIGEGGLVYSADHDQIINIRKAGNFGFSTKRETEMKGTNSKISEYTAAIALATLDAFPEKIKKRQQVHQWYLEEFDKASLSNKGWRMQKEKGNIPYQFMSVLCPYGKSNKNIIKLLANHNIEARTYFSPACHQQSFFTSYERTAMNITDPISSRILSLPLWEEMMRKDVVRIINVLSKGG